MLSNIETLVKENFINHDCYVKDDNNKMILCKITRVDFYISNSAMGVNLHLKRSGNQNFPHCVNLYGYRTANQSTLPYGFTNIDDYVNYYKGEV